MRIKFSIDYHTSWGDELCVSGDSYALGNCEEQKAAVMRCLDDGHTWELTVEFPAAVAGTELRYRYIIRRGGETVRRESGPDHKLVFPEEVYNLHIIDRWQTEPDNRALYSSAFTDGIFRRQPRDLPRSLKEGRVTLCVEAPEILPSQQLAICGEGDTLGRWNTEAALRMNDSEFPQWSIRLRLPDLLEPVQYKFVILDRENGSLVAWEKGPNRTLDLSGGDGEAGAVLITGLRLQSPLPRWKGAGTAIPVFSLRSEEDFGTGDFSDIRKMVDWCVATGQNILQLLPVNDTTMTGRWTDSYPYNAVSSFALHPLYIRPAEVGRLRDNDRRDYYERRRRELNELEEVDYENAMHLKMEFLREIFPEKRRETEKREDYAEFLKRNEFWLPDYAVFCTLRDRFGTPDFHRWGEMGIYSRDKVERFIGENAYEIAFVYFVQYHLDRQLSRARDYARSRYVVLKGDLPIGVSRDSVEMWSHPELFHRDGQAGAPPDHFSIYGQNWGFPTYNWEAMLRDGLAWWKARLCKMAEYFDAYRIDHLLGFFRIWEIPLSSVRGLLGVFNPALPFTPAEIEAFGFPFSARRHAMPCVSRPGLSDIFGDFARQAADEFLSCNGAEPDLYRPQGFADTQRKVEDYFRTREPDDASETLREGMLTLLENQLFIEDPYRKGLYHPRITGNTTEQYKELSDSEKAAYDRLYHDFFYERQNDFWAKSAMQKLPALIGATGMLCCGEDLGMIPLCVPEVMARLHILSLEIQRMPKQFGVEFGNTWGYPYLSVCTTSTHDMPGIRGWWAEDHAKSQRFYNNVLSIEGPAPQEATGAICKRIVDLQLDSPSMLCILPLQDWLSVNEQIRREDYTKEVINIPACSRHYWRYRMHLTLEALLGATDFNASIRRHIKAAVR